MFIEQLSKFFKYCYKAYFHCRIQAANHLLPSNNDQRILERMS